LLSGCVITAGGRAPGNATFSLTFAGQTCPADVASVRLTIPGEALPNGGSFPCAATLVVDDLLPGPYDFTVDGLDVGGTVLYTASGHFNVNGDVGISVDLTPTGAPAFLQWTFPANGSVSNPTCSQAGIVNVMVSIDGTAAVSVPCEQGQSTAGYETGLLTPGGHTVTFSAVDANGFEYYGGNSTVTASSMPQVFDLAWTVGTTALRWTLADTGATVTCGQAGVTQVYVNFKDGNGTFVYPGSGTAVDCTQGPVGTSFYLRPGSYTAYVQGTGTGGDLYTSQPFPVTVSAGVFADEACAPMLIVDFQ
jgi:hypothetical protein